MGHRSLALPLILLWMGILMSSISEASVIEIDLTYKYTNQTFLLNSTQRFDTPSPPGGIRDASEYRYALYSINGSIIDSGPVIIPGPIILERYQDKPAEILYPETQPITLYIPYAPKIKLLVIHDISERLLTVDLMQYNRCDLNERCDEKEDLVSCPEDCQSSEKDGICQNIEDGYCRNDPDCQQKDIDCIRAASEHNGQQETETTTPEETAPSNLSEKPGQEEVGTDGERKEGNMQNVWVLAEIVMAIVIVLVVFQILKRRKPV